MTFNQLWIFCGVLLLGIYFELGDGQAGVGNDQPPIGAYRVFSKSNFQCVGRPAGYYADIESGCQVYHMCDGLGRQFSYSCPNTTLFQQRMLICDHWYMVNCSKAESNYDANLLIGQRDKPFVTEDEHELRTPRPDLLDRPYAPDYAGESFRNQYKVNAPAHQNTLPELDYKKQSNRKAETNRFEGHYVVPSHWSTKHPTKTASPTSSTTVFRPKSQDTNNIQRRNDFVVKSTTESHNIAYDLGVSASQDIRRSEPESNFENSIKVPDVTKPSIYYSPPFLNPDYRKNDTKFSTTPSSTTTTRTTITDRQFLSSASTAAPVRFQPTFTTKHPSTEPVSVSVKGTEGIIAQPNKKIAQKNIELIKLNRGTTKYSLQSKDILKDKQDGASFQARILARPSPFQASVSTTPANKVSGIQSPYNNLLPPYELLHIYDDATTQGPPIYYEWKIPASGLEPPHVSARSNDYSNNRITSTEKSNKTTNFVKPANGLQPPKEDLRDHFAHNPFLTSVLSQSIASTGINQNKSPTPRSISTQSSKTKNSAALDVSKISLKTTTDNNNYLNLKKLLFIPDYTFPLELDTGRSQYQQNDSVNSFQIRIPERRIDDKQPWYGENAECPECHPSFLKPGTCEPCVKIR